MKDKEQTELDHKEVASIAETQEKNKNRKLIIPVIQFKDLRQVLSLCYSSRNLDKITIRPGRIYDGKIVEGIPRVLDRPYIHAFIQASKGSYKSAHANAIKKSFQDVTMQDYVTYAGLRGSIGEEGDFIPPLLFSWAKKLVILDEVVKDRRGEFSRMMLQVLEGREYTYKLGRKTEDKDSTTDRALDEITQKGGFYKVKDSNVTVFAPFTCIMLSMYDLSYTLSSQITQAMLDRMLLATYTLSEEDRDDVEDGFYEFKFTDYNPPSEVEITPDEYVKIKNICKKKLTNRNPEFSHARILDNMIRSYAVVKGKIPLESGDMDAIFDLVTKVSGAYWIETAPPRKQRHA